MTCVIAIDAGTTGIRSRAVFTDDRPGVSAYREFTQHFPQPGWVEHDPTEIWDAVRATLDRGRRARRRRRGGGDRHHQPARDRRRVGPLDRAAVRPGDRVAGPPDRRPLRRAGRRRARSTSCGPAPGWSSIPYFSGTKMEWLLGAGRRARHRRPRPRHDRRLGDLEPHGRRGAGDRRHQRQPHDAVRHPRRGGGTTSCATCSTCPDRRAARRSSRRAGGSASPRTAAACPPASRSAASPAISRRPCSARRASTPGMAKNTYGTGSFVLLNVGADVPAAGRRAADDDRLDAGRRHRRLRPRGLDLLDRLGDPVAARRARRDRRARPRSVRWRRASTTAAGVFVVPAFTGLGSPWWDPYARGHGRRHHPRHDPSPPRPGRRRVDGVPDPRCRRGDGAGQRTAAARAAGRRWCVGDGRPAADPGRSARRHRAAADASQRRQPSARRTWPRWPKACCPTSQPSQRAGSSTPRSSPTPDRATADAAHATWLRAVERSRAWAS